MKTKARAIELQDGKPVFVSTEPEPEATAVQDVIAEAEHEAPAAPVVAPQKHSVKRK